MCPVEVQEIIVEVEVTPGPNNEVEVTTPGPQGGQGPSGTIAVGTVTTVDPGDPATVTNVGSSTAAVFDFEIPQGEQGIPGDGLVKAGPFAVASSDDEDLTGEIWDSSTYFAVDYVAYVRRGTATIVRVEFSIMFFDGGWLLVTGGERYDDDLDEAEVTFTVDPTSGQINAENTGSGSVNIYVEKNPWAS